MNNYPTGTKLYYCVNGHKTGKHNANYVTQTLECFHAHCNGAIDHIVEVKEDRWSGVASTDKFNRNEEAVDN